MGGQNLFTVAFTMAMEVVGVRERVLNLSWLSYRWEYSG